MFVEVSDRVAAARTAAMATLGDTDPQFFPNFFFDISQKAEYRRTKEQKVLPTLVQKTVLFNAGHDRCLLAEEHSEVMGCPVFVPRGSAHCLPWPEALRSMTTTAIRSAAGNGMHLGSLGCVLMYVFGFTLTA